MKHCAVIGGSSGTGLAIVQCLAAQQIWVRAISRHPPPAREYVEPFVADVTEPESIAKALMGRYDAVFFTVDLHGVFKPKHVVREVLFQGCVNAVRAAGTASPAPKFMLVSVIGPETPSWVWWLLDALKPGMKQSIIDREQMLKRSSLPYVICRAPKLNDEKSISVPAAATQPQHKLDMKRGISRAELARVLIRAAQYAPVCSSWDVFSDQSGPVPNWLQP